MKIGGILVHLPERGLRRTAMVMTVALALNLVAVLPEIQAQAAVARPKHRTEKSVKGHKVGVRPRKKDPATQVDQHQDSAKWPQAGTVPYRPTP